MAIFQDGQDKLVPENAERFTFINDHQIILIFLPTIVRFLTVINYYPLDFLRTHLHHLSAFFSIIPSLVPKRTDHPLTS